MENTKEVSVYVANSRLKIGFFRTYVIMINNIIKSKGLIVQLFKRDFLSAYKKSFLGFSWILLSPVVGIVSWVFLNSAGILKPGDVGIPFPAYVLLSSSLWGLFMGFYSSAAGTLTAGMGFIMQVKYPHEVLLIKQVAQQLANFSITFAVNLIVLLLFGIVPDWRIIFFPIVILPMFFLGSAIGLISSVVSVVATDVTNILGILLGLVFYATPIVYVVDKIDSPLLKKVVELNPLTYLIGGVRDLIIKGEISYPERFLLMTVISFVLFMLSWRLFFVSEEKVIEKML